MLGPFIQIHVFVKCFSTRQDICPVINSPDMPTGKVPLPQVLKLVSYHPGCHLEYIKFSMMHQLHHLDVTRMMSVTQESVKLAFCMQIAGVYRSKGNFSYVFCNQLPFCLHSYFFFILLEAKCLQLDSNFMAYI